MGHQRPHDPSLIVQDDRPCDQYSRPADNKFGLQERVCKCGRARIVKISHPHTTNQFLPILDGVVLPWYWKLDEAKEAIDAADQGDPLPKPTRPVPTTQYQNVGAEAGAASFEAAKEWFRRKREGTSDSTPAPSRDEHLHILGLDGTASIAEIRARVRTLQHMWHPDRNPDDDKAAEEFRRVSEAWEALQAV